MTQLGVDRSKYLAELSDIRATIDDLDEQIIDLLRRRIDASHQAQGLRTGAGEPRLDLARERVIFARYSAALGTAGTDVTAALLRLCRGPFIGRS